jgi:hypothetical protein
LIEVYFCANAPQRLRDVYSWYTKILDAEYEEASNIIDGVFKTCENLHVDKQGQLKILLHKYGHLFDGILGEINMEPINLQLIDPDCKSDHAHVYNAPTSVEQQMHHRKKVVRLVDIGVLEEDFSSE